MKLLLKNSLTLKTLFLDTISNILLISYLTACKAIRVAIRVHVLD
jgi:hypothetical protein